MIWLVVLYLCVAAALGWRVWLDTSDIDVPVSCRARAVVVVAVLWLPILVASIFGVRPDGS